MLAETLEQETQMTKRGRPANAMTKRRLQVLAVIAETCERPSWCEIARRCGLHDHASAKRIVRDLARMGKIETRI